MYMCVSEISRETKKGSRGSRGRDGGGGRVRLGTRSRSASAEEEEEEGDEEAPLPRQMERLYKGRRITAAGRRCDRPRSFPRREKIGESLAAKYRYRYIPSVDWGSCCARARI